MKYSVVVPVYNAENTLRRCVDSIMNQNFTDMQLVLINDGSPDNSGKICEEYAKKYDKITITINIRDSIAYLRNQSELLSQKNFPFMSN